MSSPQQLSRTLGLRLVIVFVIANVIGSGVYKKVAPMADALHSPGWILIAWVIGGTAVPGTEPGTYRFRATFGMAGRWQLSLGAKLQGETGTVESKLVIQADK